MKVLFPICLLASVIILMSCNRTDFSNPEKVLQAYRELASKNRNEKMYNDYLSKRSKEYVTKDEFIKAREITDSTIAQKILESKIYPYPADVNNPSFRRFKVEEKVLIKSDTTYTRFYYTLANEDGKWKVIWTSTLFSFAGQKYFDGNYSEARKTLEKIIEINPFDGTAYSQLAWCYNRDKSLLRKDWEDGFVKNAKYAVVLEEDNPDNYNTLSAYYSSTQNYELSIQSLEQGLKYCQNNRDKLTFFTNLAGDYAVLGNYKKAEEYVKKSIEIDDKDPFVWFRYGGLMRTQNKIEKAKEYYAAAIKLPKMENSIQGNLYYNYAYCCFHTGICEEAKEHINKALEIEPDNDSYQQLYYQIKNCQ